MTDSKLNSINDNGAKRIIKLGDRNPVIVPPDEKTTSIVKPKPKAKSGVKIPLEERMKKLKEFPLEMETYKRTERTATNINLNVLNKVKMLGHILNTTGDERVTDYQLLNSIIDKYFQDNGEVIKYLQKEMSEINL